jgi:hypothetical protein
MSNFIFCPVCQRKNKSESERCVYCGSALRMKQSGLGVHTTLSISPSIGQDSSQAQAPCQEYLQQISAKDICFILEKKQTPIILHDVEEIILGRFFDGTDSKSLDLDPFDGGAYGVSRRHARIVKVNDKFVFEDLMSTNGSWLNGQRLPTGTTFPLMSGDQIWLGQLKMQVCFHQTETAQHSTLLLRDTSQTSTKLTPERLTLKIGPYLTEVSNLQHIADECFQQDKKNIAIEKIDASGADAFVIVEVVNHPEAIHLIRKWITPWQHEQQFETDKKENDDELTQAIVQLSSNIAADIAPDLTHDEQFALIEQLLPTVKTLATSSIELSFDAL